MTEQDIGVADGWLDISEDDERYHSTVAFFSGGAECVTSIGGAKRGYEVLIWQGVPKLVEGGESGEAFEKTVFDGFDEDEVPDGCDYLIEVKKEDGVDEVTFADDFEDAKAKAREKIKELSREN